jgi:hypothetical protein
LAAGIKAITADNGLSIAKSNCIKTYPAQENETTLSV